MGRSARARREGLARCDGARPGRTRWPVRPGVPRRGSGGRGGRQRWSGRDGSSGAPFALRPSPARRRPDAGPRRRPHPGRGRSTAEEPAGEASWCARSRPRGGGEETSPRGLRSTPRSGPSSPIVSGTVRPGRSSSAAPGPLGLERRVRPGAIVHPLSRPRDDILWPAPCSGMTDVGLASALSRTLEGHATRRRSAARVSARSGLAPRPPARGFEAGPPEISAPAQSRWAGEGGAGVGPGLSEGAPRWMALPPDLAREGPDGDGVGAGDRACRGSPRAVDATGLSDCERRTDCRADHLHEGRPSLPARRPVRRGVVRALGYVVCVRAGRDPALLERRQASVPKLDGRTLESVRHFEGRRFADEDGSVGELRGRIRHRDREADRPIVLGRYAPASRRKPRCGTTSALTPRPSTRAAPGCPGRAPCRRGCR